MDPELWSISYMSGTHFQYKFNSGVCFVIKLPYLIIISGMLNMEHIIYVCKILILI